MLMKKATHFHKKANPLILSAIILVKGMEFVPQISVIGLLLYYIFLFQPNVIVETC